MVAAYRGSSVILFAPIAALAAVLLTSPPDVAPVYTNLFMEKMVGFVKLYFPVFMLGALFGKVIELSGFSKSIVSSVIKIVGADRAILSIVLVSALLTYFGVSLFVVVFAVYPFAAEMFRQGGIPKRLIPGTIALGAFSFTMDSLPGTVQIQNIIPTTFFKTDTWAAPILGTFGALVIFTVGLSYLSWLRRRAQAAGEGYGTNLVNEPEAYVAEKLPNPFLALLPLVLVGVVNRCLSLWIEATCKAPVTTSLPGLHAPITTDPSKFAGVWSVEAALLVGILTVFLFAFKPVVKRFTEGSKAAVAGALLASMNTASEYGFGAVIAALPGFLVIADLLKSIPNPLVNEAITITTLAGVTGSASGGMSIALAAMADTFMHNAQAAGIPLEVLHRVASMASGGMDTLPHNGAVITLLSVTGLTHRQAYRDVFAITMIKTLTVFVVIAFYYLTGLV
jgi:H+/gluconate symporter-like permease